jgi:uncharacterized protein DUF4389
LTVVEPYPLRLEGRLDPPLSRWLWLVKILLLIPHYILLAFLWLAFLCVWIVALFAILFTARFPRALFDFNVGVMRWTWRVSYYGLSALGTDRYPPFSLGPEPDYPATLEVDYPDRLSRGLVLVKWWLLAIPQYLIVAFFAGGGQFVGAGLIGILTIIAGFIVLFTNRYPPELFELILGLNRWCFRVAAYASLMTDKYPPFRLDMGGSDVTPSAR